MMKAMNAEQWTAPRSKGRLILKHPYITESSFILQHPCSPGRMQLEYYVRKKFHDTYNACVEYFLPYLLGLLNPERDICAVIGMRPAETGNLFLEQYLEQPVESVIASVTGVKVQRDSIVELGNLVATWRGGSHLLFLFLAVLLERTERDWIVFTATAEIERMLQRLDFIPVELVEAKPERLIGSRCTWGSYYDHRPRVMLGHIPAAMKTLRDNPYTSMTVSHYAADLDRLSMNLPF